MKQKTAKAAKGLNHVQSQRDQVKVSSTKRGKG